MPTTYALRLIAPNTFQMAKFNADFNVDATYTLTRKGTGYSCDCPASYKGSKLKLCKHQRMMPYLMGAVNLPRFLDPDTGNWHGLMALAPGMRMEHEDGEELIRQAGYTSDVPQVQKGVAEPLIEGEDRTATQIKETIPDTTRLARADAVMLEPIIDKHLELLNKEPAPATPDQAGHVVPATQTQRLTAPAVSAPASNQVTRRI